MKRITLDAAVLLLLAACTGCNGRSAPSEAVPPAPSTPAKAAPLLPVASSFPDAGPISATVDVADLDLLTYNVLASPIFDDLRWPAVFATLDRSDADVIALQEVTPAILRALLAERWASEYDVTKREGEPVAPGGQLILSRLPIRRVDAVVLMGRQRRTALVAEIEVNGRRLAVATSHMESFLEDGPTRARQLEAIFGMIGGADDAVFMGDLNFGDGEEPETSKLDPRYVDVWTTLRPTEAGFTWNMEQNPFARIGAFIGEPSRRLDRILVRSDVWRPGEVRIIGDEAVGRRKMRLKDRAAIEMPDRPPTTEEPVIDVYPSDHYGLSATLIHTAP